MRPRTFSDLTASLLKKGIDSHVDMEFMPEDFVYGVMEDYNNNGTCTSSPNEAQRLINKFPKDVGILSEQLEDEGMDIINSFSNPEGFLCQVVIEDANNIIYDHCDTFRKLYDKGEKFTLTQTLANKIKKEVNQERLRRQSRERDF